jgi:hypothetical protein
MAEFDENADSGTQKRGRNTISDGWLSGNRDSLLGMFGFWWPEIGYQLECASRREDIRNAFQPLKNHPSRQYIDRLLRETYASGKDTEIRKKRFAIRKTIKETRDAHEHCSACMNRCRDIESAMIQAREDQAEIVLKEFSKRREECQAWRLLVERLKSLGSVEVWKSWRHFGYSSP